MSAPHEAGGPRDSLVRAQFAPDSRRSDPGDPARLQLVLDNHDSVTRLVRIELAGPLARFTRPRRQPRLELPSRRQQEVTLEVRPEDTRPEGAHAYDLHAVVIDEKTEQILFTCTARIGVERTPAISARAERATPYTVVNEATVQLRVHVRNTGNVQLQVDAQKVTQDYWVRDDERRRDDRMLAARRAIRAERSDPRTRAADPAAPLPGRAAAAAVVGAGRGPRRGRRPGVRVRRLRAEAAVRAGAADGLAGRRGRGRPAGADHLHGHPRHLSDLGSGR
jgi:hypothetical protein